MVDDPNRKSPRTFQCRDYLWESFEQLSRELECSVDYLINESMRQYLRAQGRPGAGKAFPADGRTSGAMPAQAIPSPARGVPSPAAPHRPNSLPPMPGGGRATGGIPSLPGMQARAPAMPSLPGRPAPAPAPAMPGGARPGGVPPLPGRPPLPSGGGPAPAPSRPSAPQPHAPPPMASAAQRTLYAICGSDTVPVTKEEFFIGRGQKSCDLVIKDTNISRQHARVVLHNGQFWLLDNQSTNGVEFRGAKIQQKRIEEGDVFTICGHDVHFTYR